MALSHSEVTLDLLADVAAAFCRRDADRVRGLRDAGGELDREMWRRIADNGWLTILVPERLGGAGLGLDAATIVARRLGHGAFPEPFAAAGVLAPLALAAAGDEALLAPVLSGETVVGVGLGGRVSEEGGGLTGEARSIAGADAYVVEADGRLWMVSADAVATQPEPLADGTLSARLTMGGTPARALASAAALEPALDAARIVVSAELLGIADAALELTLDYLRQRKQFGRPIGSFQALQHRAVDMWMARELAAAALGGTLRLHADSGSDHRQRAQAAAGLKARAAQTATSVTTAALQCHGAIGFTDEYDLGLYLNRALALAPWLGNVSESRRRYLELDR